MDSPVNVNSTIGFEHYKIVSINGVLYKATVTSSTTMLLTKLRFVRLYHFRNWLYRMWRQIKYPLQWWVSEFDDLEQNAEEWYA